MHPKTVVAIDAGRSAIKVAYKTPAESGRFLFPSAAMVARKLSDEAEEGALCRFQWKLTSQQT